jgi:hypothetical protein
MKRSRCEIERGPAALGGGRRLRLFAQDPEAGEDV